MIAGLTIALSVMSIAPKSSELTIYNQDFGLVKEVRVLDLKSGVQLVSIEDVAERIEANSVGIRSVSAPGSFSVLEQNYQYDLISPSAILNKAVGGKIILNRVLPDGEKEKIVGTLLSSPTSVVSSPEGRSQMTYNGMVIRTDDGRILLNPTGEVEVLSIPEGLISRPTLIWEIDSQKSGSNEIELSYLTKGINWKADYVLNLDQAGALGDLKGWVTLDNRSGATYKNATLKLLAGDVQRIREERMYDLGGAMEAAPMAKRADFEEEQFADYHLYTLQRPATIRNNETKQVSLLEGFNVPIEKRLVIDAMRAYTGWRPAEGAVGVGNIKPQIRIEFKNDKKSNLGMPLPMGTVKVFQRDSKGSLQMLGENRIEHTPKDERISLVVGRAFDIVAERKRLSFEYIRTEAGRARGARETYEIEVRNRKETTETVSILERHWGDFIVSQKNMEFKKLDANTIEFVMVLKPNEVRKLVYTVETRW